MLFNKSSIENKCIFIHIPKAAGISIESTLFDDKFGHNLALDYLSENQKLFNEYYKFSFVRNPYHRFASAFFYLKKGGRNKSDRNWSDNLLSNIKDFRGFVMALKNEEYRIRVFNGVHFRKQYQFVCDGSEEIIVDFLGRFENLEKDFNEICGVLGKNVVLKHENSASKKKDYMAMYDDEMKKVVYSLYKKDFDIFGYESGL